MNWDYKHVSCRHQHNLFYVYLHYIFTGYFAPVYSLQSLPSISNIPEYSVQAETLILTDFCILMKFQ